MQKFDFEKIKPQCENFGFMLTEDICEKLNLYGNMLIEWNEKINLTAITDPDGILYKHFYDCLLFLKAVDMPENASVIDVGTGAGFPGMVLKIARPDINLTLLDGLNKRLTFLSEVLCKLNLTADLVHSRAESLGQDKKYREKFDIATARAVANLPVLCEYCIPFVKKGGTFVAMKGAAAASEAESAQNAYKVLGCEKPSVQIETLTGQEERAFIIAKKISQTSPKYPRNNSKISKSAL